MVCRHQGAGWRPEWRWLCRQPPTSSSLFVFAVTVEIWGTWLAQSIGIPAQVHGFEPHTGLCTDSVEPAWDFVSLSAPPVLMLSLALSLKNR